MEHNKIYLGDAYDLIKKIPDKSIDLIYTDPPYQINQLIGGNNRVGKSIQSVMKELDGADIVSGINEEILEEFIRVMIKPNIYIWCNKKQIYPYMRFFIEKHGCNFVPIVWRKSNAMPLCGGKYLDDCEYCLYFYKGVRLNTKYDTAKTVYEIPINVNDKNDFGHPTIKPLEIVKNHIINSSNENQLILDPFIGSGTTAVACKELGRNFIGFEINEKYHKIAVDRLNGIKKDGQMSLLDTDFEQLQLIK